MSIRSFNIIKLKPFKTKTQILNFVSANCQSLDNFERMCPETFFFMLIHDVWEGSKQFSRILDISFLLYKYLNYFYFSWRLAILNSQFDSFLLVERRNENLRNDKKFSKCFLMIVQNKKRRRAMNWNLYRLISLF